MFPNGICHETFFGWEKISCSPLSRVKSLDYIFMPDEIRRCGKKLAFY
jgi:hypothetical protein